MSGIIDVHLTYSNPAEIQDLFYDVSKDFVSLILTSVVIGRLPRGSAFLEA